MNKKGFSLIELLAIIIIIGLILIVALPAVTKLLKNNNNKQYENYLKVIEVGAKTYSNYLKDDLGGYNDIGCTEVSLDTLISEKIIKEYNEKNITCDGNIILKNNKGNVSAKVYLICKNDKGKVTFEKGEKDSNCELTQLEPSQLGILIANKTGEFNENNWAKKDFLVSITGNGTSYKWCSSTDGECIPSIIENNSSGSLEIKSEGTNTVCAMAINDASQSEVKCNSFKLDKTKPVITNATVTKSSSNFTITADLSDSLSSILEIELVSKTTIAHTTSGLPFRYTGTVEASSDNTLTFSVTDEAGNKKIATGSSTNDYVSPTTYYASFGLDGSYPICHSGDSQTENEFYYVNTDSTCPSGYTADERYIVTEGRIVCWKDQVLCASCSSGYTYDTSSRSCVSSGYRLQIVP